MGLPGLVPPYCALVKYIGFADVIVFQKLLVSYNGAKLAPVSPINVKVDTVTKFFLSIINRVNTYMIFFIQHTPLDFQR